jgi:hypothetical protein
METERVSITTHRARITGPVSYRADGGSTHRIPLGPCLVEMLDDRLIDIIWGAKGQRCAALAREEVEAAQDCGYLVLLD